MVKKAEPKLTSRMAKAAKSKSNRVHVTSRINGWVVKKEGYKKASTSVIKTQKAAIREANKMVQAGKASAVVVHRKDGKIRK